MAKGGSLLGKADSTLAQMSYREAMADVAPDLKSVYQEEMLTQVMFEKGVQDYFDTLYADNNALAKELEDATAKAMTGLGTDYQGMELFNNELNSMKERMKALPKGKKGDFERAKIRAEMSELLKSSADLDATITKIGTMIDNKEYDINATGSKNLALLTSIANGTAKKNIKNGKLFYSMDYNGKTVEMDRDAVEGALVQDDPKFQVSFEKISPTYNNKGKQKDTKWEDSRQAAINDYAESFTSEAAYAANINKRQGGLGYTFVEALMGKDGSDSIYKALMDMGPATIKKYDVAGGPGGKSDGKITEADFASPENGITLIKSLTDIHDKENFDFETAKLVAGEFYADKIAKKEFEDGMKMRPKSGTAETSEEKLSDVDNWFKSIKGGGTRVGMTKDKGNIGNWYNASTVRDIYNDMLTGKLNFEGFLYTFDNGTWFSEDLSVKDAKKEEIGNQETFARGILNQRNNVWTQAEVLGEVETIDYKSGLKKDIPEIMDDLVDQDLGISVANMADNENVIITTLNNLLPPMNTTEENYNFQVAKTGKDGQGFNRLGNKVGLYTGDGKIVKYPYDYEDKKLRLKPVVFETAGENPNEREDQFRKLMKILDNLGIKDIMSKGDRGGTSAINTSGYK